LIGVCSSGLDTATISETTRKMDQRPEAAFKKPRASIEALARRKYPLGELESENSVAITTQDAT
jgi:hypothetical protein